MLSKLCLVALVVGSLVPSSDAFLRKCFACLDPLLGLPKSEHVYLQGFNWHEIESNGDRTHLYHTLQKQVKSFHKVFDGVFLPPVTEAVDNAGYLPSRWYSIRNPQALKALIKALHKKNIYAVTDVGLNHRSGSERDECSGEYTRFDKPAWSNSAVVRNDAKADGNPFVPDHCSPSTSVDTGENYVEAPDIDHTNPQIRADISEFLAHLRTEYGIDGWRYNFVRGYDPVYLRSYNSYSDPKFSFGDLNKDVTAIDTWARRAGGNIAVTDFPLRNALNDAIHKDEFNGLAVWGSHKRPAGYIGVNPSNAVTFVDNHDSIRFNAFGDGDHAKVLQAYAYILTHPGTPVVFWDHWQNPHMQQTLRRIIKLRKYFYFPAYGRVAIDQATHGLYSAYIGSNANENTGSGQIAMKLGSADWVPRGKWKLYTSGHNFAIWIEA